MDFDETFEEELAPLSQCSDSQRRVVVTTSGEDNVHYFDIPS
jgi:hypothetical protein